MTRTELQRLNDFKWAIFDHLYARIDQEQLKDVSIPLAALAEVTAQFAYISIGRSMTVEMFVELQRKIAVMPDNGAG